MCVCPKASTQQHCLMLLNLKCVCVCVSKLVQQQHVVAQQVLGHHRLFEVIIRVQNVLEAKIVLD